MQGNVPQATFPHLCKSLDAIALRLRLRLLDRCSRWLQEIVFGKNEKRDTDPMNLAEAFSRPGSCPAIGARPQSLGSVLLSLLRLGHRIDTPMPSMQIPAHDVSIHRTTSFLLQDHSCPWQV